MIYSNSVLVCYSFCPKMTFWNFLIYKIQIQRWITVYLRSGSLKYVPAREFAEEIHNYGEFCKYQHVNGESLPLKQTNNSLLSCFNSPGTYSTSGFTVWYWLATAQYNTIYQELCSIVVSLRVIHNWRWLRRFPKMTMKVEFIFLMYSYKQ